MGKPTFIWSLFYPAPETRTWCISGLDVDGRLGLEAEVLMYCDTLRHSPRLNMCRVCGAHHELPKPTNQRYAYKWYPMKPSLKSVMQWNRRNWERGVDANLGEDMESVYIPKEELKRAMPTLKLIRKKDVSPNDALTEADLKTWEKMRERFWFGTTFD